MVKSVEEIMASLNAALGDNTDDATLGLLEDVQDTLNAGADSASWKQKYEDNDKQWRERYRERFNQPSEQQQPEGKMDEPEEKPLVFENLFKEG